MLSTSFIVARQPAKPRQEGFSRNSVNSPNIPKYETESAHSWTTQRRDTERQKQEKIQRSGSKTRDTSRTRDTIRKLGRSMSMSKRNDFIRSPGGKPQADSGRSVSQTRDPQGKFGQTTWDRNNKVSNNDTLKDATICEGEGATKFGYSYTPSLYGTISGDARSIYAIQSRPLPNPNASHGDNKKHERSLYENIDRFTSIDRLSTDMSSLEQARMINVPSATSTLYGTRSRIPVYKPRTEQTLGQRAVTQMEISRTYEDPSILSHSLQDSGESTIRKGLMWIQQDKLFSRWKERYVILTTSYLQIFKKGATRFSDMGTFISKVKLSSVNSIALEDKRGYLTLVLTTTVPQEGKLLLRKTEGLKDWHDSVVSCCHKERQKRSNLQTDEFWNRKQLSESYGFEGWLSARDILGTTLEDSPCSSIGRPYRPTQLSSRTENLYCDPREYPVSSPNKHRLGTPMSTLSERKVHTLTSHTPVRLHQAMFSPPKPPGVAQRERY